MGEDQGGDHVVEPSLGYGFMLVDSGKAEVTGNTLTANTAGGVIVDLLARPRSGGSDLGR